MFKKSKLTLGAQRKRTSFTNISTLRNSRPTKDLNPYEEMKGSGTPMKHRRTHIPRFFVMLVGHF